jgi:hypothetical protein
LEARKKEIITNTKEFSMKTIILLLLSVFSFKINAFEASTGSKKEIEVVCGMYQMIPWVSPGSKPKKAKGCVTVTIAGTDDLDGQVKALKACEKALSGPNVRPTDTIIKCTQYENICHEDRECSVGAASNTGKPLPHSMTTPGSGNPSWSDGKWTVKCCGEFSSDDPMNIGCPCPEDCQANTTKELSTK